MSSSVSAPRVEDVMSVGSRISWGAILAGAVVALAIQFLLGVLGGAVGLTVSDRVESQNLRNATLIWVIVTGCAAVFAGGMVTSQFTVGENKMEALLYGIIMWAVFLGLLFALGATGQRSAMLAMSELSQRIGPDQQALAETVTRLAWYSFAGTWLTMFAGAAGALVGAGPTFRIQVIDANPRVV